MSKLSNEDLINIGIVIACHHIGKTPISGGFLAKPLGQKFFEELSPKAKEYLREAISYDK